MIYITLSAICFILYVSWALINFFFFSAKNQTMRLALPMILLFATSIVLLIAIPVEMEVPTWGKIISTIIIIAYLASIPIVITCGEKYYDNYHYFDEKTNKEITTNLSFSSFEELYNVAPKKWEYSRWEITYQSDTDDFFPPRYHIGLKTRKDYLKYVRWYNNMEKNKEKSKRGQDMINLTHQWRKDVNDWAKAHNIKEPWEEG